MKTNTCIDCGMPRPNHTSNCPGWTDEDYAALEAKEEAQAIKDDPWAFLLEAAKESLYPGPAHSMDRAKEKLRRAIKAVEGELRMGDEMIRLAQTTQTAQTGRGRDWTSSTYGRTNA